MKKKKVAIDARFVLRKQRGMPLYTFMLCKLIPKILYQHQFVLFINKGLKVIKKNVVFENNYWKISGAHDGYTIKFGTNYERSIEFYPEQMKFIG